MGYKIRIQPKVYFDVENAYLYYSISSLGVAEKFYKEFNSALDIIKSNPFFQIRYKSYRSLKLNNFPYSIYYEVDESEKMVTCYALVHLAQDSDKYPK
ncbi:MAG: type II toxin-antitoxin system RelE/ParE family toxin [Bacteroidota bacterium]|nr:type II toxin-antitoxin system RelE/ParE family toxin [Bacteroidota bacterium]